MKIAVMGAGAVGCFYGAMLARAGHDVILVGRSPHVEAISKRGLRLETKSFDDFVKLNATSDPAGVARADLVLVAVKSPDTEAAGRAFGPHLSTDAVVVSLQNGVDNAERLEIELSRPVIPAAVYVASEMVGPGHVKHYGRGELVIGHSPTSKALADAFSAANVPTEVSANVIGALWSKLAINCAYNAFSAASQRSYGDLVAVDEVRAAMSEIVDECVSVAGALGITMPTDLFSAVLAIADAMPEQLSSTAQDIARGKRSEIDYLNGFVVRKGDQIGRPAPANRALLAMIKLIEGRSLRK